MATVFGSNMHQIVQRLGLHSRPHWGSSQRPQPSTWYRGGKMRGTGGKEKEGNKKDGRSGRGGCLLLNPRLATPLAIFSHLLTAYLQPSLTVKEC